MFELDNINPFDFFVFVVKSVVILLFLTLDLLLVQLMTGKSLIAVVVFYQVQ